MILHDNAQAYRKEMNQKRTAFLLMILMLSSILLLMAVYSAHATVDCASYLTGDTGEAFGTNNGSKWEGQSFHVVQDCAIATAGLKIKRVGAAHDGVVHIHEVSGTTIGTQMSVGTITGSEVSTADYVMYDAPMSDATLVTGQEYLIEVECPNCTNSEYFEWYWDETSSSYADGNAYYSTNDGVTWSEYATLDGTFQIFGDTPAGGGTTTTTASTTVTFVENPNQDVFNGLILFLATFFGLIFYFRKGVK